MPFGSINGSDRTLLKEKAKSLTYRLKSKGLKIQPWRTPSECSSSDDPSEEENHDMETRCSCGKNRRHTDVPEACVSNRCPCFKLERPCSRKCRCYNCKNKNDSKPNGINNKITNKGCRCGLAKKNKASDASNKSCRDGVRKSKSQKGGVTNG